MLGRGIKKAGNIFGIFVGLCMVGMWGILFSTGQVNEMSTEPFRIMTHLFPEGTTAIFLIVGGLFSLKHSRFGERLHFVSIGMLLYSVVTAGGYYLQLNNVAMTIMFGVLFVATVVFI
ncbi:MAG TPA: hypothetical protein DER23_09690, partial [Clostridiales bacterium]|nr:hypothetical protein [Clostridiales bacterium]